MFADHRLAAGTPKGDYRAESGEGPGAGLSGPEKKLVKRQRKDRVEGSKFRGLRAILYR